MYVCLLHVFLVATETSRKHHIPGTGVMDGCKSQYESWGPKPGSPERRSAFNNPAISLALKL